MAVWVEPRARRELEVLAKSVVPTELEVPGRMGPELDAPSVGAIFQVRSASVGEIGFQTQHCSPGVPRARGWRAFITTEEMMSGESNEGSSCIEASVPGVG